MAQDEDKQMVLAFMTEAEDVDPVSGNEVPPGSLPEEVRDDIPARLSEGEYVVPADVLRFYGVKFFEDLRENAKIELARMDREGRIGGEPIPNEELSDEEKAELDSIGAAVGGFITGQPSQSTMPDPYQQQQMMYRQGAPVAMGNAGYQEGGLEDGSEPTYTDEQLRNAFAPGFSFLDTPVDSAATSSVILYGPNGEVVTLFLPAQQDLYDEYIEKGYSTEQVKVTTETEVGQPQVGGGAGPTPQQEVEDINRGLALNQRMDAVGNISDVSYAYPYVAFKALARGMGYIRMGELPPRDYYRQTSELLGASVARGLSGGYDEMIKFLYDGTTQDNPEAFKEAVNKIGGMFGNLFQGYSRVLSPINDAIKLAQGPDYYNPDRNLAERKKLSQTFRYVDEIFNLMGIYEKDPQRKFVATDYDEFAFSSPVPFLLGREANVSYVEQIMNQIGVPKFMLSKGSSKYGAVVKSEIDSLISTEANRLAEKLWKSPKYQDASLRDKRNLFDTLRTDAKSIVMDRIANMDTSEEFNTSEQIWRKKQLKALKEIKGKYGDNAIKRRVSELKFTNPFLEVPKFDNPKDLEAWVKENRVTDIEDMSADQIEAIISYMEIMNDKLKADYKEATE